MHICDEGNTFLITLISYKQWAMTFEGVLLFIVSYDWSSTKFC